ncbi:RNA polymerase sigma factor [Phenylobacterium sp.]|jgi:RNA polymerase sigma factor (sigma-70 family)|uniref:RNA polymerase sigma factor n=1 Tax=Phenylobacterium sp. TaxID=1871053 RepID=UPI003782FA44
MIRSTAHPSKDDEARWLNGVAQGDLRAFEALYRTYHPRLTRFLSNMLHRPALVEEVLDDTMLVVWSRPEGFGGSSRLSTWIFGIAYRKALKAARREDEPVAPSGVDERPSLEASPEQAVGQRQSQIVLLQAIRQLSPEHRAVVDLAYFHEMAYREIAEVMNCPVDTVKTRMFYARRHLKTKLAGRLVDWL